jgi:hypothetical protein
MHVAALEQLAQHVADLLPDAEQADRAAFGGFGAAHDECLLVTPAKAGVHVDANHRRHHFSQTWMPAFAGMTLESARALLDFEHLEHVARLDVVGIG